ncbi:MAG: ATP-dependent DNA ligase [Nocardioidaceae bacterium]
MTTLLAAVVDVSQGVAGTGSRLAKRDAIADLLRRASPEDVEILVSYLGGELRQRRTGVGWASLRSLPEPAAQPTLEVADVDAEFERLAGLSGPGSASARSDAVQALFARATEAEQRLLRGLVSGDVRQGALDASVVEAVAAAADVPLADVRRAVMLRGATAPVAAAALAGGAEAVAAFTLTVGQPIRPMLASSAPDMTTAFDKTGGDTAVCLDTKLDGIRIQVHRSGDDVRVYTRSLDDITDRLTDVAEVARSLPSSGFVLDGEAMTLDESGRPRPFQETASRTATRSGLLDAVDQVAVTPYFFDLLHHEGTDLLDLPLHERLDHLDALVPTRYRVPRLVTNDPSAGQEFFLEAVSNGQEGVVVKSLSAPYEAGRRGAGWVKVKPRHTLDLVVLAVEWGSGRRKGWLSNIHLGAHDPETGGWVMLGKTFKGMTDEMLAWQTARFLDLEESRTDWVVTLRPEQVVEIAFDGLQRSSRYPGGVALRFARVLRYRDDKQASEADTIETVLALSPRA